MADKYPNWFSVTGQYNFEKFLLSLAGKEHLCFLQLGVYTGDASVWLCENVLTGKECLLMDVDTWQGSEEIAHEEMNFNDVFETYKAKTAKYKQIGFFRSTTTHFLQNVDPISIYDFIYVDADHTTVGVILDAELSWPLLKPGGIMAFDDYTWGENLPLHQRPRPGIDLFLLRHEGEYELLVKNSQLWIKKH